MSIKWVRYVVKVTTVFWVATPSLLVDITFYQTTRRHHITNDSSLYVDRLADCMSQVSSRYRR
jgi:hypothetical protein